MNRNICTVQVLSASLRNVGSKSKPYYCETTVCCEKTLLIPVQLQSKHKLT